MKRAQPLYQRVYAGLRRQIISGVWREGDLLPSERELAATYEVSAITVRHATELLAGEGLITKHQGRGMFVSAQARREREILWVCGVDTRLGDIAPFYAASLCLCEAAVRDLGYQFQAAWLRTHSDLSAWCVGDRLDRFAGYIFIGCAEDNAVLRAVRGQGRHHVLIGRTEPTPRCVWLDFRRALDLALAPLAPSPTQPVHVFCLPAWTKYLDRRPERAALRVHVVNEGRRSVVEHTAYVTGRNALPVLGDHPRICVTDDVVARGLTRALLEAGLGDDVAALTVVASMTETIALGLPTTYVVHSDVAEAAAAVRLLHAQIEGHGDPEAPWCSTYRALAADAAEVAPPSFALN